MALSLRSLSFRQWFRRPAPQLPARRPLGFETLEDRTTPTVSYDAGTGVLSLTGTAAADQFTVRLQSGNPTQLEVVDNGAAAQAFILTSVTQVAVSGVGGDDTLTLDLANGLMGSAAAGLPVNFSGGAGSDSLRLSGDAGAGLSTTVAAGANAQAGTLTAVQGANTLAVTFADVNALVDTSIGNLTVQGTNGRDMVRVGNGPLVDGSATSTVSAGTNSGKVALNHMTGSASNPSVLIYVDEAAVDAHLNHGDTLADVQGGNADATARVPVTFANKSSVTINTLDGNDVVTLTNDLGMATGLNSLIVNGGVGADALLVRDLPAGVSVTLQNLERVLTNDDDSFVYNLYTELLRRPPTSAEVDAWLTVLKEQGAVQVVAGIAGSVEARAVVVRDWYVQFLNRPAANNEEQAWVNMLVNGTPEEQVLPMILASAEFQARANALIGGANADENYVRALYQLVLNREPESQAVVNGWVASIAPSGRQSVAQTFLLSAEFRARFVTDLYLTVFNRTPTASEVNGWVQGGLNLYSLRVSFLVSAEFDLNG